MNAYNSSTYLEITPQMKQVIDLTHESFKRWKSHITASQAGKMLNRYVQLLCEGKTPSVEEYAELLHQEFQIIIDPSALHSFLFGTSFRSSPPRLYKNLDPVISWSQKVSNFLLGAIQGNHTAYERLCISLEEGAYTPPYKNLIGTHFRFLVIMFESKFPELDEYQDMHSLVACESNLLMTKYLGSMLDAICNVYGFSPCKFIKQQIDKWEQKKAQRKVENQRIDQLRSNLIHKDSMLQDLQDTFDSQLAESKAAALTDFFAQLNSDRYGNILDMMLQLRKGVTSLSKSGYELPEKLNGLFTLYHKLVQFIRDSHIDPIRKIGSQATVHASDIEFCIYEGTPFTSEDETKLVETVSPGWIYRDRNIQISRPKVKEVIIEETLQNDAIGTKLALCETHVQPIKEVYDSKLDVAEKEATSFDDDIESAETTDAPQLDETEAEVTLREDDTESTEIADVLQPDAEVVEETLYEENVETIGEINTLHSSSKTESASECGSFILMEERGEYRAND